VGNTLVGDVATNDDMPGSCVRTKLIGNLLQKMKFWEHKLFSRILLVISRIFGGMSYELGDFGN